MNSSSFSESKRQAEPSLHALQDEGQQPVRRMRTTMMCGDVVGILLAADRSSLYHPHVHLSSQDDLESMKFSDRLIEFKIW